ncbi:hypothetical protein Q5O14_15640 [Eubacteriaceae bacterium ES2]|nr:hypothetical protein Q5O14_15640 [Eubacteriaceae bacterium ES2]
METIKQCGICGGSCHVKSLVAGKKQYYVSCEDCGNESEQKNSRAAAVAAHNRVSYTAVRSLFAGAPDAIGHRLK